MKWKLAMVDALHFGRVVAPVQCYYNVMELVRYMKLQVGFLTFCLTVGC